MNPGRDEKILRNDKILFEFLEHSRGLFIYHAGQRLNSLRYFFASYAIFVGFYVTVLIENDAEFTLRMWALFIIGGLAWFVTLLFSSLDKRNAELVHVDENAMHFVEVHLDRILELDPDIEIERFPEENLRKFYNSYHKPTFIGYLMDEVARDKKGIFTYKVIMDLSFKVLVFVSLVAALGPLLVLLGTSISACCETGACSLGVCLPDHFGAR